ncbi:unnamed protein product [Allacma fusca]|uniref:Uncharacterized protein n=1 Tax=Allacma fusca TaxID=39272 RepID=A0A8J2P7T6_9HEXA|nr:unnamed protein product [Allacma fusca]
MAPKPYSLVANLALSALKWELKKYRRLELPQTRISPIFMTNRVCLPAIIPPPTQFPQPQFPIPDLLPPPTLPCCVCPVPVPCRPCPPICITLPNRCPPSCSRCPCSTQTCCKASKCCGDSSEDSASNFNNCNFYCRDLPRGVIQGGNICYDPSPKPKGNPNGRNNQNNPRPPCTSKSKTHLGHPSSEAFFCCPSELTCISAGDDRLRNTSNYNTFRHPCDNGHFRNEGCVCSPSRLFDEDIAVSGNCASPRETIHCKGSTPKTGLKNVEKHPGKNKVLELHRKDTFIHNSGVKVDDFKIGEALQPESITTRSSNFTDLLSILNDTAPATKTNPRNSNFHDDFAGDVPMADSPTISKRRQTTHYPDEEYKSDVSIRDHSLVRSKRNRYRSTICGSEGHRGAKSSRSGKSDKPSYSNWDLYDDPTSKSKFSFESLDQGGLSAVTKLELL